MSGSFEDFTEVEGTTLLTSSDILEVARSECAVGGSATAYDESQD